MNEVLLQAVGCQIWEEKLKVFTQSSGGEKTKEEKGNLAFSFGKYLVCLLGKFWIGIDQHLKTVIFSPKAVMKTSPPEKWHLCNVNWASETKLLTFTSLQKWTFFPLPHFNPTQHKAVFAQTSRNAKVRQCQGCAILTPL